MSKWKAVLAYVFNRIKEPSSGAGAAILGVLVILGVPSTLAGAIVTVVVALAAVGAIVVPEGK